jgi:hypothetical protein
MRLTKISLLPGVILHQRTNGGQQGFLSNI